MMMLIYIILSLAAGYWLGKRHAMMQAFPERARALALFDAGREVTNDTVQTALGVSDATATRILDALEKEGQIVQIGGTGRGVIYKRR